jgi:lysophospholipase L1-like esterase
MRQNLMISRALICMGLICFSQLHAQTTAASSSTQSVSALDQKQVDHMRAMLADWPDLGRYRDENASLPSVSADQKRVVFFGDSITDSWGRRVGTFFPGEPYLNRGISGQTTPQMLIRFQQDVVHLHPAAVVILAGTNDIAGNTGPSTLGMIEDNFESMVAIAKQNGIKVVISSVLPAAAYPWKPEIKPAGEIRKLNQSLSELCRREGLVYLDYYSAMADDQGGMRVGLSSDGVHPTAKGYEIMAPLAEDAIKQVLHP